MITIANANALHIPLPDRSVQCVVTSPPYWGLRDYGTAKWEGGSERCDHKDAKLKSRYDYSLSTSPIQDGSRTGTDAPRYKDICPRCGARRIDAQIGLESTPAAYVAHIVAVMRECWRVLKDDGVLWLNLGDSYAARMRQSGEQYAGELSRNSRGVITEMSRPLPTGLKEKDLCGIPWRVAFALQDDGWYLRSDIIWAKPNPMPESVTDRPTKAHEYVFLLTKQARYYYDAEAIKENFADERNGNLGGYKWNYSSGSGRNDSGLNKNGGVWNADGSASGRNRRSVWTVATQPYSGAHFATFPPALIEPMILAGTSARGECPTCGKAWARNIERVANYEKRQDRGQPDGVNPQVDSSGWHPSSIIDNGWRQQCSCPPHEPIPQTVLDPFAGSGTTGAVAVKHGRKAVLLDLNTKYMPLQFDRTDGIQMVMI